MRVGVGLDVCFVSECVFVVREIFGVVKLRVDI